MYDYSLHHGRICRYCLHSFIKEEVLKYHTNNCFKINGNQVIKHFDRKIKSPFMIYVDFEILVPESKI